MSGTPVSACYRLPRPDLDFALWSLPRLLARQAERVPDRTFLRWTHEDPGCSFAEVQRATSALADQMAAFGLTGGDRVALFMHNSLAHVVCWFALNTVGAVDAPVDPTYSGQYLRNQIELVRPRVVICDASLVPKLDEAFGGDRSFTLLTHDDTAGDRAEIKVSLSGLEPLASPTITAAHPTSIASIMYTSGTTGPSKGVQVPHAQTFFFSYQTQALHRMTAADTYLAPYPLFHASGRVHGVGAALVSGATCVLYDRFSAREFARRVALSQATVTHFLGSMMTLVLQQAATPYDRDSRLRSVMALPTPSSLVDGFKARFGAENVTEVIGMTELSWPVMAPYGQARPDRAAGLPVADWFDVAVVDPDTDLAVTVGQPGELVVRAKHPWITGQGYENMPAATVAAWRNLWFHTGDVVRIDDAGWIYYVDRIKDSIRRRGENVSSYEVEEALREFPAISDAAVVGRRTDTEELDDEVFAFLVLDRRDAIDGDALGAHLSVRLPKFAVPTGYRVVDSLPTTPSGKVRKEILRGWVNDRDKH